jgi:polysaccharide biosynthesis/export protein
LYRKGYIVDGEKSYFYNSHLEAADSSMGGNRFDLEIFFSGKAIMKKLLAFLFVVSMAPLSLLCAQSKNQSQQSAPQMSDSEYIIGPEDVLRINVWKEADLSLQEVVVRPDGKISVPLVNDIQAAGITPRQLQEGIAEKLKAFMAAPTITVTVLRVVSQSVSVVGQVARPGSYPLGSNLTVLDVLARAGGLTEYAKEKEISVVRKENGKTLQFPVNYKEVIKGKKLQQNITLKRGDVVLVP